MIMKRIYLFILVLGFIVSSCSSTPQKTEQVNEEVSVSQNENSFSEDEFFLESDEASKNPISEEKKENVTTGYASWYGKELQGKPTASGEIYDMNKFTAAHRTFPMNSIVLVKNTENGKKQLVRINDRGPYVDGRIIDVSYATAKDLGFAEKGVAPVEIELIQEGKDNFLSKLMPQENSEQISQKEKSKTEESPNILEEESNNDDGLDLVDEEMEPIQENNADEENLTFYDNQKPKGYTIQIGAFHKRSYAEKYREELEDEYNMKGFIGTKGNFHFVLIGDFSSKEKAKAFYKKLRKAGIDVVYKGKIGASG